MWIWIVSPVLLFGGACAWIRHRFFPKPPKRNPSVYYDAALVLGCPCQDDGTLSRMQKRRMAHALHLYEQGCYKQLIISGGSVRNAYNEATRMASYIPAASSIPCFLETQAASTFQNFALSQAIWKKQHCQSMIVITSPFHARRANYFAKRYFRVYCVSTYPEKDRLRHTFIEWFSMGKCLWYEHKLRKANKAREKN